MICETLVDEIKSVYQMNDTKGNSMKTVIRHLESYHKKQSNQLPMLCLGRTCLKGESKSFFEKAWKQQLHTKTQRKKAIKELIKPKPSIN